MNTWIRYAGRGPPLFSNFRLQLHALFKNATGKGKVERSFHELLTARLKSLLEGKVHDSLVLRDHEGGRLRRSIVGVSDAMERPV